MHRYTGGGRVPYNGIYFSRADRWLSGLRRVCGGEEECQEDGMCVCGGDSRWMLTLRRCRISRPSKGTGQEGITRKECIKRVFSSRQRMRPVASE